MARKNGTSKSLHETPAPTSRPISLKEMAAHLGLSTTTLSLVLNDSPLAKSIPQETQNRIFEAARKFNYRPHFVARSLRAQRTFTLGVLVPELSSSYAAMVLTGIEDYLLQVGYFYIAASHRHRQELIERYPELLLERCVEGLIAIDTPQKHKPILPVVSVSGHDEIEGVTNIILNHDRAAELALAHLQTLGHQHIAVIKGQTFTSDTNVRWQAIRKAAKKLRLPISSSLVVQLETDSPSPETGYVAAKKLLAQNAPFTALFAFNDVSALGAIRAFHEAGLRVPEDISVVGFDDIYDATFNHPSLTTIRQPLAAMGKLAAETLLQRINNSTDAPTSNFISVEPELIVRESTGPARH
jgi:LacI family transcriptional regulator